MKILMMMMMMMMMMMAVMVVVVVVVVMVVILKVWHLPPNIVSLLEKRHLKSHVPLGVTLNLICVRDRPNCLIPVGWTTSVSTRQIDARMHGEKSLYAQLICIPQ